MVPTPKKGYFEGLGTDNPYFKDAILYFEYGNGRKDGMTAWKKRELNT